jgi:hypothetical protein
MTLLIGWLPRKHVTIFSSKPGGSASMLYVKVNVKQYAIEAYGRVDV